MSTSLTVRHARGSASCAVSGTGPTLVLLHGLQVGKELFDALSPHLARDFTVLAYDQRDRGQSTAEPGEYGIDDLADDLAALLSSLGMGRVHVLGTSYGGMVAQAFALRHPEHLDHLVLAATSRHPFPRTGSPPDTRSLIEGVADGDPEAAKEILGRFATSTAAAAPGIAAAAAAPVQASAVARRMHAADGFDTRGSLRGVITPTLVLHGKDDPVIDVQEALAITEELPHGTLLVLDSAGHTWENDVPERAARMIAAYLGQRE